MRALVWPFLTMCIFPVGSVIACDRYREPAVNFAGITSRAQLEEYRMRIALRNAAAYELREACYRDLVADNRLSVEAEEQESEEFRHWMDDWRRFDEQLKQAGEAHLALIAARPFKGAYTGDGMSSTGGASASRPAPPVKTELALAPSKKAESAVTSSPTFGDGQQSNTYTPIENCLMAKNGADNFGTISIITNSCHVPLEANWVDTDGGTNMITVGANNSYKGGNPVKWLWACRKDDLARIFDNETALCLH